MFEVNSLNVQYVSIRLYCTDTMKGRLCLASCRMRRVRGWGEDPWDDRWWQQDRCLCMWACLAPIQTIVLDAIVEGGWMMGTNTEAKWLLCSMVSCRDPLVQGQSGCSLGEEITQNKGETGNNHKSTSSDILARCILTEDGVFGRQLIK